MNSNRNFTSNKNKSARHELSRKLRQFMRAKAKFLRENPGSTYSPEKGARDPVR